MRFKSIWFTSLLLGFGLFVGGLVILSSVNLVDLEEVEAVIEKVVPVEIEISKKPKEPVTMVAVGDMMLGRYVETLMNARGDDYPFINIADFVKDQDIVFGNLEGPIVTDHIQTPDFTTSFSFHPRVADLLAKHGFTIVSLANNHTLDKGVEAYEQTQMYLAEAGIVSFGHAEDESSDYVFKTKIKDKEITFLGFNEAVNPYFDSKQATETVAIEAENEDIFMIVSIHWGIEYELNSAQFQQEIAHDLVDAGADLIIGHHPHVTQELEVYNDRMIFYSLGNFIFDQYFSVDVEQGLAFDMRLYKDKVEYDLLPVQSKKSVPRLMVGDEALEWLSGYAEGVADEALREQVGAGTVVID